MVALLRLLAEETGLPVTDLLAISHNAPRRYKVFSIPKRSGRGLRTIAQPARELKIVQRAILDRVLVELPVHSSAAAYRSGSSISANARVVFDGSTGRGSGSSGDASQPAWNSLEASGTRSCVVSVAVAKSNSTRS